uniref:Peptidase S1 domain-containing protein n=1 Tax=Aquila chrysaetos chrysaetos TaxID=223781 RepID=A0A663F8Y4_AQUCH
GCNFTAAGIFSLKGRRAGVSRMTCQLQGALPADLQGDTDVGKIVGGTDASRGEIPWQVSLKEDSSHFCGGTIIGDRWLLSAAHSYVGTTSLNGTDGNAVKVNVTRVIQHPLFDPIILDFDVAILELARPLVFSKYIQPVCLPLAVQKFPVGKKCIISGWGNLQEGNGMKLHPGVSQELQASVGIIDQKTCNFLYNFSLTDRMICAGFLEGKIDSCQVRVWDFSAPLWIAPESWANSQPQHILGIYLPSCCGQAVIHMYP